MADLTTHYRQLVGIASSWATQHLPHWSDDLHRALLERHGATMIKGRISASSMTMPQLSQVLDDYERRGWPRQHKTFNGRTATKKVTPQIGLMVKLWGKLGLAGKVDNSTRAGLLAFCARQVGRDVLNLDVLSAAESQKIIEALKSWLGR